jgi:hypothetical protein
MGEASRPLWAAIEQLRKNPTPGDARLVSERTGRREMLVQVGARGFWLVWEVRQDRGETVVRLAVIEVN